MPEQMPIKETKEMAIFLAKLGVSTAQCVINKGFKFSYFIDDLQAIPAAIGGMTDIPAELKDIDSEEAKEVIEAVTAELAPFGITDSEAAKHFIHAGISFAEGIILCVKGVQAIPK